MIFCKTRHHAQAHVTSGALCALSMAVRRTQTAAQLGWWFHWPLFVVATSAEALCCCCFSFSSKYKVCSKKDETFAIKTLLLILQHFKHCPLQSSPLYWRYTVPNVSWLLDCFLERTFCAGRQFSYCIFLNLLCGLEMMSFQSGFKFGKQENVCWGSFRKVWWMGHNGCLMFCQITADEEQRVSRRIVVVQHPSLVFPQFRTLPAHSIPQTRQYVLVQLFVYHLSTWYKFMMGNAFSIIKKHNQ